MDDNISLLKTIEKTYTNNELIEILVYKKNEIDALFQEQTLEEVKGDKEGNFFFPFLALPLQRGPWTTYRTCQAYARV